MIQIGCFVFQTVKTIHVCGLYYIIQYYTILTYSNQVSASSSLLSQAPRASFLITLKLCQKQDPSDPSHKLGLDSAGWTNPSYLDAKNRHMGLSLTLNPMVLLIIIPMKNGYFIGNINPTFSEKPTCVSLV